ncbi:MAG: capsule biosynthesis protein, partial [Gammaproteobacteria bacterium]|nr:capsule biosynthesis protein [Gammaproteobacteria bacterium]
MRAVMQAEADAIAAVQIDETFEQAVRALLECRGKVITTGIGKA